MPQSLEVGLPNKVRVLDSLLSDQFVGKLETLAQAKAEEYKANTPYPHIYFDDFLPIEVAEAALRDFPQPKEADWHAYTDVNQRKKLSFEAAEKLPPSIRDVLYFLNSRPMLKFLETLTGIQCVLPDPTFTGGGLHQIRPGGLLEVHADFSYHNGLRLDRRINALIYLNKKHGKKSTAATSRTMGSKRDPSGEENSAHLQPLRHLQYNECVVPRSSHTAGMPARSQPEVHCDLLLHQWPSGRRTGTYPSA